MSAKQLPAPPSARSTYTSRTTGNRRVREPSDKQRTKKQLTRNVPHPAHAPRGATHVVSFRLRKECSGARGESVKGVGSDSIRACASMGGSMERERMLKNKDRITKQVELETERRTLKQQPHIEHDAWLVAAVDEDRHRREGGGELCEVLESGSSGPRGRRVSEAVEKSVGWKDQDQTKHAKDMQKQTRRPTLEGTEVGVHGQARHSIVRARINHRRAKRWKDQGVSIKVRRLVLGLVRAAVADGERGDAMRVGRGSELGSALAQGMGRRWVRKGEKTGKAKPKADGGGNTDLDPPKRRKIAPHHQTPALLCEGEERVQPFWRWAGRLERAACAPAWRVRGWEERRAVRCASASGSSPGEMESELGDEWEGEPGPSIGGGLPPGGTPGCGCSSCALPCEAGARVPAREHRVGGADEEGEGTAGSEEEEARAALAAGSRS
ncbi:hypothetical protein B0H13DRAFT_1875563 [Mycena leptocephala]|nr:hypothetical protein B0H13DRAFT_1875563 [Mycena leptocephala]